MLKRIIFFIRIVFLFGINQSQAYSEERFNPNEEKPIEIQSDSVTFDDKKSTATYVGHVNTVQGDRHLSSDTLVIWRDKEGKVESLVATGHPARFLIKPSPTKSLISGQAKIIKFFPKQDKLILLEEAMLIQNEQLIQGENLVYIPSTHVLSSEPVPGKKTTLVLPKNETHLSQ